MSRSSKYETDDEFTKILLYEMGIRIENDEWEEIHYACHLGDVEKVKSLLDRNLEVTDENGSRPIHIACEKDRIEVVRLLMDRVDLEAEDGFGMRPIHIVCRYSRTKIFRLLMGRVDLEAQTRSGIRPIHLACSNRKIKILKLLIDRVNLEAVDNDNFTPIKYACRSDRINNVKMLIDGFVGDKIYGTKSKVKLNYLSDIFFVNSFVKKEIIQFIKEKMELMKKTLFSELVEYYYDLYFVGN